MQMKAKTKKVEGWRGGEKKQSKVVIDWNLWDEGNAAAHNSITSLNTVQPQRQPVEVADMWLTCTLTSGAWKELFSKERSSYDTVIVPEKNQNLQSPSAQSAGDS